MENDGGVGKVDQELFIKAIGCCKKQFQGSSVKKAKKIFEGDT